MTLRDLTVAVALRRRLRHILYGRRQSRRAADRHDEEYRLCAGGARAAPASPRRSASLLGRHFIDRNPKLARVDVDLIDHGWSHIAVGEREHGQAFVRRGPETRTARVVTDRKRRRR